MNWQAWSEAQTTVIAELKRENRNLKERVRRLTEQRDRWRTYAIKGRPTWKRRSG
jgi:Fe-S cluster biosynthesis and repair protein YggX